MEYANMVKEVTESTEFKNLLALRQRGLQMVFDAIDGGVAKNDLAAAFKVDVGLIDGDGTIPLSKILSIEKDYEESLESTVLSLKQKFPNLTNSRAEGVFENECAPTEEKIDYFFENIDQFRDFEFDSLISNKTAGINDHDGCHACGGDCESVYVMLGCSTIACILGGSSGDIFGCAFGIWSCACAVCPEDLPWWAGRGACGGNE